MPFFHERGHYAAIVAVLRAADNIDAKVRENGESYSIEVKLTDGSQVLWTNRHDNGRWAYTIVRATESPDVDLSDQSQDDLEDMAAAALAPLEASAGDNTEVRTAIPADLPAEEIAVAIAVEGYPEPAVTVTSDQ